MNTFINDTIIYYPHIPSKLNTKLTTIIPINIRFGLTFFLINPTQANVALNGKIPLRI